MGQTITAKASDGHQLAIYLAQPSGTPKGAVVVVQEIFVVNSHIRGVADGFAADGYLAVAPALFDRIEPGIELGYDADDVTKGRDYKGKVSNEDALKDVAAALEVARSAGRVGVVGYCWGGTLTFLSATRIPGFAAASGYYGGGIGAVAGETPMCPTMMHFGEQDHAIPMDEVNGFKAARSDVEVFVYPAGHGFNCDQRGSWNEGCARIARERTIAHLAKHVG